MQVPVSVLYKVL